MKARLFVFAVGLMSLALLSIREWDLDPSTTNVIAYRIPKKKSVIQLPPGDSKGRRVASTARGWKPAPALPVSPATLGKLEEYWRIRKKVFLDLEQERRLSTLRRDSILITNLAPIFDVSAKYDQHTRNIATNLLLDAVTKERSSAAALVMKGIIADASVEDLAIPIERREALAEAKSDIMFRWSTAQPERSREISRTLPGPVSRKLWEKVQSAQYRKGTKLLVAIDD